MVPFACAIFPQNCSIKVSTIKLMDPASYEQMHATNKGALPERVYFNKGL